MDYPYRSQWDEDATARNNDCGPACVAMVLQAFGQHVAINDISAELMPGSDVGTDARDLVNALTKRGIRAQVWAGASGYPAWPAICLVKYSGFERARVQDKGFMGWHWMLVLGLSDATVVCHDPDFAWNRRNEGAFKYYSRGEFDAAFIPYGGATKIAVVWEGDGSAGGDGRNGKDDPERPAAGDGAGGDGRNGNAEKRGKNEGEGSGGAQGAGEQEAGGGGGEMASGMYRVKDGPANVRQTPDNTSAVLAMMDEGTRVSVDDFVPGKLNGGASTWAQMGMSVGGAKVAQMGYMWADLLGQDVTPGHASPTFTASKTQIVAGETVTLAWNAPGASGIYLGNAGVSGPANHQDVQPHPANGAATYTLRVTYDGEADVTLTVTIVVTPAPQPAPTGGVHIGYHVLGNGGVAGGLVNEGCNWIMIMNDPATASALAAAGHNVMYREYSQSPRDPDWYVNAMHPSRLHPAVVRTVMNEGEGTPGGVDGIRYRSSIEINVAQKLKALNPAIRVAAGSMSTGTPDFTDPAVCAAMKACYAQAFNAGLIWWDQHTYSPDMDWIHKGTTQAQALVAAAEFMVPTLKRGYVGRNSSELATWVDLVPGAGYASVAYMAAVSFGDNPTAQDWFETRWHFLYTRCGFDPKSASRIVSGETGVDKGSVGGFKACGATPEQVAAWCKRYKVISSAPMVVGGVTYASPFVGAALFQADPSSKSWAGYDVSGYTAAIKAAGVY